MRAPRWAGHRVAPLNAGVIRLGVALQFIEVSALGVRAAHYRLRSPLHSLEFDLFPMIHIGSAEFYAQVRERIDRCDVVLFEGISSLAVKLLTASYTLAARSERLGLVTQRDALPVAQLKGRLIHADFPKQEFEAAWAFVPWYWRVAVGVGAPVYGLWLYFTASRESIGRRLGTNDLESREDIERFEDLPEFENAVATGRDVRLVAAIERLLERPGNHANAGVVYGAAHMRHASRLLTERFGYRVVEAEWLNVFQYAV